MTSISGVLPRLDMNLTLFTIFNKLLKIQNGGEHSKSFYDCDEKKHPCRRSTCQKCLVFKSTFSDNNERFVSYI